MDRTTHAHRTHMLPAFIIGTLVLIPAITHAQTAVDTNASAETGASVEMRTNSVRTNAHTETQTEVRATEKAERREAFEARAAEIRAQAATNTDVRTIRAERARVQVSAQLENRLRTVVATLQERIEQHIERLSSVADRIEERADILEARGVTVDTALALVADARIELRNASIVVNEDLPAEVAAALEAENPRDAFSYVKESLRSAAEHVRVAHRLLREAVAELKTAVRAETGNSSDAVRADVSTSTNATAE